jgi:hypothetical protein
LKAQAQIILLTLTLTSSAQTLHLDSYTPVATNAVIAFTASNSVASTNSLLFSTNLASWTLLDEFYATNEAWTFSETLPLVYTNGFFWLTTNVVDSDAIRDSDGLPIKDSQGGIVRGAP